jgi:hypothetical protein
MGIDLNKMRQKHSALTNRGGDTNDYYWKPEEGTHQIRLVCPETGDPFFEAYYHYSMGSEGRTTVLSPRTFGDEDPIAEWGTRLWNEGTDASKEAAKRFWPKMRVFAPIVVRGEEDKGVRWWGFSRTTYQALLDVVLDPEYGDITDTEKGTDIRIDYGKKQGQSFPTTDVRPMRRTSALADTEEKINTLLETLPSATDVFERTTFEQCEKVLSETLGETPTVDSGTGNVHIGDGNTRAKAAKDTKNNALEGVADIESAFDDLLA